MLTVDANKIWDQLLSLLSHLQALHFNNTKILAMSGEQKPKFVTMAFYHLLPVEGTICHLDSLRHFHGQCCIDAS